MEWELIKYALIYAGLGIFVGLAWVYSEIQRVKFLYEDKE
jgi:hypothetical protein